MLALTMNSSSMMMPSDQMSHFSPDGSSGGANSTSGARYRGDLNMHTINYCRSGNFRVFNFFCKDE